MLVLPILGQYYLLHCSHFSRYASKFAFTKISDCIYRVFRVIATSNSSIILLYFHFHFIYIVPFSVLTFFISLPHFHFFSANYFILLLIFVNFTWAYHYETSNQHNYGFCCQNNRFIVTSHWQTLKEVAWLVTDHVVHLLFTWFVDWKANSEVYTLCNYSHLI